ncbi:N-acetylglucosamine-6-phosphate deacetylase [Gallaecimonas sp. GXIMD4217]|uniref:N-acetylglucosamine-6-phosphate deacetylase n=1 Tax=Gallaecimonas sp. GXIMD4217 TaxID=3131927 RepID=UPI00311B3F77
MKTLTLKADRLFDGDTFLDSPCLTLVDGRILSLGTEDGDEILHLDGTLAPGFIDIQVNGGGDRLFNNEPSLATLGAMVQAHGRFGTTAMLPTLITDDLDKMTRAADTVALALEDGMPGILGIHFEGPHLSQPKRGIHQARHIRPLSDREMALYCRQDLGIRLVTLAPEQVPPQQIAALVAAGAIVCLGHSDCSFEQANAALEAGATGFTHLFNAMSPFGSREPGMVGAALAHDGAACGLILDGHHVHPAAARVALKALGEQRLLLVTDAMQAVGSKAREFPYFDEVLHLDGDRLSNQEGRLAGSALNMAQAVANARTWLGVGEEGALRMASRWPARFLGLEGRKGMLRAGMDADLVLLDRQGRVKGTWLCGRTP